MGANWRRNYGSYTRVGLLEVLILLLFEIPLIITLILFLIKIVYILGLIIFG